MDEIEARALAMDLAIKWMGDHGGREPSGLEAIIMAAEKIFEWITKGQEGPPRTGEGTIVWRNEKEKSFVHPGAERSK